jgi:hypothetical protein
LHTEYQYFLKFASYADCGQKQHTITNELESLRIVASKNQLTVVNVPEDGNCMFSALALQLGCTGPTAAHDVCMELVGYMRSNPKLV